MSFFNEQYYEVIRVKKWKTNAFSKKHWSRFAKKELKDRDKGNRKIKQHYGPFRSTDAKQGAGLQSSFHNPHLSTLFGF
jgi:hypothetical protein